MAATVARLEAVLTADTKKFDSAMRKSDSAMHKVGSTASSAFKIVGLAAIAGGAVAAVGLKKSIDAASNLNESMNAVQVVFGKSSKIITDFGKDAATKTGLSMRELNEAVTPIGASLRNTGFSADQAAKSSVMLAQRAADMASVFNTDVGTALEAIQAGLRGESDPLEKFGVGLSAAAVQSKAMEMGLAKTTAQLTAQDTAQARLALLMEQTNRVSGDFANTSDGLANSQRILHAEIENASAQIGTAFLPVAAKVATVAAEVIPKLLEWAGAMQSRLQPAFQAVVDWVQTHWTQISTTVQTVFQAVATAFNTVKAAAEFVWPKVTAAAERTLAWYQGTLKPAIDNVIAALTALWNRFGGDITRIATIAFTTAKAVVTSAMHAIQGVVETILAVIRGDWSGAWNGMKETVRSILSGLGAVIKGAMQIAAVAAKAGAMLVVDGIRSVFAAAAGAMWTLGSNMIQGLINGIKSMAGAAAHAAIDAVKGAYDAAAGFLHVKSPSRLYHQMGVDTMLGYINGIDEVGPKAAAAMRRNMGFVSADARRGLAEVIVTFESAWERMKPVLGKIVGASMAPTQYRSAAGMPLSDTWVQQAIDYSLAQNPQAAGAGGYNMVTGEGSLFSYSGAAYTPQPWETSSPVVVNNYGSVISEQEFQNSVVEAIRQARNLGRDV